MSVMTALIGFAQLVRAAVAIAILIAAYFAGSIVSDVLRGDRTPGPSDRQFITIRHNATPQPMDPGYRRQAATAEELCFSRASKPARSANPELDQIIGRLHGVFGHDVIAVMRQNRVIDVHPLPLDHPWLAGTALPSCVTNKADYPAIIRTSINPQ